MLTMQGLGLFFLCAVVSPHGSCRTGAPGVKFSISVSVLSLLVTQARVRVRVRVGVRVEGDSPSCRCSSRRLGLG